MPMHITRIAASLENIVSVLHFFLTPNVAFSRGRACLPVLALLPSHSTLNAKGRNASVIRRLQRLVRCILIIRLDLHCSDVIPCCH